MKTGFGQSAKNVAMNCRQLATVRQQQLSFGNVKMNQGQPHPRAFLNRESVFLCHEWNVSSLFLSKSVGFKKSRVLMTGVSLVNKTCE